MERWTAAGLLRQAVIAALDLQPGLRLLELGCGPGRLAIEIKRRSPDVTVHALDGDPEILTVARMNAANAGVEIAFTQADITRLPETGRYDRIYSTFVFHHLSPTGKQEALSGLRRVLVPGGHVVIADFGRPRGAPQWVLFSIVGWLDGAENTRPHRDGAFEKMLCGSFGSVESPTAWRTIFGTVQVFVCRT